MQGAWNLLRLKSVSSIPVNLSKETLAITQETTRRRRIRLALYWAACVLILVTCFLVWSAVIEPYRPSREMAHGQKWQAIQTAQAWRLIWVNTSSGIYHRPRSRWYGNTKEGKFLPEWVARLEHNRAALNGQ